jgi:hypothetical protein
MKRLFLAFDKCFVWAFSDITVKYEVKWDHILRIYNIIVRRYRIAWWNDERIRDSLESKTQREREREREKELRVCFSSNDFIGLIHSLILSPLLVRRFYGTNRRYWTGAKTVIKISCTITRNEGTRARARARAREKRKKRTLRFHFSVCLPLLADNWIWKATKNELKHRYDKALYKAWHTNWWRASFPILLLSYFNRLTFVMRSSVFSLQLWRCLWVTNDVSSLGCFCCLIWSSYGVLFLLFRSIDIILRAKEKEREEADDWVNEKKRTGYGQEAIVRFPSQFDETFSLDRSLLFSRKKNTVSWLFLLGSLHQCLTNNNQSHTLITHAKLKHDNWWLYVTQLFTFSNITIWIKYRSYFRRFLPLNSWLNPLTIQLFSHKTAMLIYSM